MREVLIADDHPLFRDALARAVTQALPDAHLYDADSVAALLTLIETHPHAELLLLDLHMPGANGFSALVHVRGQQPGIAGDRGFGAGRCARDPARDRSRRVGLHSEIDVGRRTSSSRSAACSTATCGCRRT